MNFQKRPLVIAHRGASADFPENSLDAFTGALQQGADWIELDVRRSKDGVLVVHHDAHLNEGALIKDLDSNSFEAATSNSVEDFAFFNSVCSSPSALLFLIVFVSLKTRLSARHADINLYILIPP